MLHERLDASESLVIDEQLSPGELVQAVSTMSGQRLLEIHSDGFKSSLDLSFLEDCRDCSHIECLILQGEKIRGFDSLSSLKDLMELRLTRLKLRDLRFMLQIPKMISLELIFGSVRDASVLAELSHLKALRIMRLGGIKNVSFLSSMESLQIIVLESCKQMTCLPDLSRLKRLRRLHFEVMNGLNDLGGAALAPCLEELIIIDSSKLDPEIFSVFVGHPSLRRVLPGVGLKGSAKNNFLKELFSGLLMEGFYGTESEDFLLR